MALTLGVVGAALGVLHLAQRERHHLVTEERAVMHHEEAKRVAFGWWHSELMRDETANAEALAEQYGTLNETDRATVARGHRWASMWSAGFHLGFLSEDALRQTAARFMDSQRGRLYWSVVEDARKDGASTWADERYNGIMSDAYDARIRGEA